MTLKRFYALIALIISITLLLLLQTPSVKHEAPIGIMHRFLGEVLNIRWDVVPSASIYDIYRSEDIDGEYKLIKSQVENEFIDPAVQDNKDFYGKTYYYKIGYRDKFNKKSPESEPYEVKIAEPEFIAFEQPRSNNLKIMRSKEVKFVKPAMSSCYDAVFLSDKQSLVYVDTFSRKVAVINDKGEELMVIGEAGIKPGAYLDPIRVAVDREDNIYLLDAKKPEIIAYDSKGNLLYAAETHPIKEKEIFNYYVDEKRPLPTNKPLIPKLNAILVHEDKIYAADKNTGVIQIYDKKDRSFVDYYKNRESGKIMYFGVVSEMLISKEKKLYLSDPFRRIIQVLDFITGEKLYEIGNSTNFIGGFMSINGMDFNKNDDLVVSDGVVHTVQVFSKDNGRYMYHLGDKKAVPDTSFFSHRPKINLDSAGPVNVDSKGRLWIYLGRDKGFTVREKIGDKLWDSTKDEPELLLEVK